MLEKRKLEDGAPGQAGPVPASHRSRRRFRLSFASIRLEAVVLVLIALTLVSIRYHEQLLRKTFVITPETAQSYGSRAYGDNLLGGNSTVSTDPDRPLSWSCELRDRYAFFFCGYEVVFDPKRQGQGIDLSDFESIRLVISYEGPSEWIRFYAKNFDVRYSDTKVEDSTKFNMVEFLDRPGVQTIETKLNDFQVASWWLINHKIPPELSQPQFENIVALDIQPGTSARPGRHSFRVERIEFEGAMLSKAQWYLGLLAFWVAAICLFLAHRVAHLKRDFEAKQQRQEKESEQLQAAMAAAETASSAKSQFLASMSHELRTPLNAIMGYAQLLQREPLTDRQATAVRTIHQSGGHLLTLITDILDLAKIEAGKLELARGSMDLPASLGAIADMIRVRAEEKDLRFAYEASADLPQFVIADEKRLRQVLINLLGNAVKFTTEGVITLRVTRFDQDKSQSRIRFEVSDTGPGIAEDQQALIFQPFEQAGQDSERDAGTGLGLSISSQIVAQMGSRIQLESAPGSGSCFSFELNFELAEQASAMPIARGGAITGYAGRRRKLLIVDDRHENRAVLADMVEQLGFLTVEAENGQEAIAAAVRESPDLILMDARMPVMDGFESTRKLRALADFETTPIVIVSASADEVYEQRSAEAGADAFLTKPVDHEELVQLLVWHLKLDWTCSPLRQSDGAETGSALVAPPAEQMANLHRLALAGNMRAIRKEADAIIALDERYRPFAEMIHELAQSYQSPALLRLIEQHSHSRQAA